MQKTKFKICPTCKELTPRAPGHFQWGIRNAVKKNLVAVEPKPNELQIDLDGVDAIRKFGKQYRVFERAGLTKGWKKRITPSGTRGHVHVTITVPFKHAFALQAGNIERICLAACLGSDLERETFNLCRVLLGQKFPILFFEEEK